MTEDQAQRVAAWQMRTIGIALMAGAAGFVFFAAIWAFKDEPILLIAAIAAGIFLAGFTLIDAKAPKRTSVDAEEVVVGR